MDRLAALPDELLPEVEQSIDEIEDWHKGAYRLSDSEREAVLRGVAAGEAGEFASDREIAELRDRYRR